MVKRAFAIAFSLIAVCAAQPAVFGKAAVPQGYLEQFKETMKLLLEADNLMYTQMQVVARRVEAFYKRHGRFPEEGVEQERFKASVMNVMPQNPYKPQTKELYYGMKMQEDGRIQFHILNDAYLTKEYVSQYRKQAPRGWQADPGTIMLVLNHNGTYAIWSTSADRLPLRDYQRNNRTRIICHNLVEELEGQ
jgi:hypothetical protein